ncbi:MAG: FeoB-associated Cys-rich membrane protein [Eubacteriales bacterium]
MLPTIIVGVIFFSIVSFGLYKSVKSMKNNSCPGCSCGCSEQAKKSCKRI